MYTGGNVIHFINRIIVVVVVVATATATSRGLIKMDCNRTPTFLPSCHTFNSRRLSPRYSSPPAAIRSEVSD